MNYREIPGTKLKPSVLCLGATSFGSAISETDSFRIMDTFYRHGGTFIDTAHSYADWLPNGKGASERTIGKWLRKTGTRKSTIVSTKGGHREIHDQSVPRISQSVLEEQLSQSLDRLQTDSIDIYWLNRDEPHLPVGEILEILNTFIRKGQVKAIGASNWELNRLLEAQSYAEKNKLTGFCASQIGWSLAHISNSHELDPSRVYMKDTILEFHNKTKFPLVAYSSQASGFFAKEALRRSGVQNISQKDWLTKYYYSEENFQRYDRAMKLAFKYRCETNTIALSYILSRSFPSFAIVGARNSEQVESCYASTQLELTKSDLQFLEKGGSNSDAPLRKLFRFCLGN